MPNRPIEPQRDAAALPALVLGSGITVLGVARLLGRAGIPAFVPAADPGPVAQSRWYRRAEGHVPLEESSSLAGYLEKAGIRGAVLVPCSDDLALEVARLPAELAARFPSSNPPASALELLVDKGRFRQLLVERGVPHPVTILVDRPEDADALPPESRERAFVKPRDSAAFFSRYGVKGVRPRSPAELKAVVAELSGAGVPLMVQEYVPGPASNHYFIDGFIDREGRTKGLLVRRRLRMYPLDFGNSSAMVTVPAPEVAATTEVLLDLLAALGYRGIFSAEFKKDERDGVLRLLEINARAWWFVEYAGRCGMDAATLAYRDALGLDVPAMTTYRVGRRLVHPYYDVQAGYREALRSPASVLGFARSWIGADLTVFAFDDPMPALLGLARGASGLLRRRVFRR